MTNREVLRLYPTLRCQNAERMIAWLCGNLGFAEHLVHRTEEGVQHAQLSIGSSILMLGQARQDRYGELVGDLGGRRTDALYLAVDDVDAVATKVRANGAVIEMEPHDTDYGSREFAFRDIEGNLWSCGTYWPRLDA
jgi:uncharacterized glyoxalase superfamily protein PhnB